MNIVAKIFDCDYETYKSVYKDAVKRAYALNRKKVKDSDIHEEIIVLPGKNVQSKRSQKAHNRSISVFENDKLKFIIGFSNTNYDEDKRIEVSKIGGKYKYGNSGNYHGNSFLWQGLHEVFEYYYDSINKRDKPQLYFYILDTDKTYTNNLTCLINYRQLETIGFRILNLDKISFEKYKPLGFSPEESKSGIKYISFNKLVNDLSYISQKNNSNAPSYLTCIDDEYDNSEEGSQFTIGDGLVDNKKYIYTFKALSAEAYDSFFTMWALSILAKKENKNLEFAFASQEYHFKAGKDDVKSSNGLTGPLKKLASMANLKIEYETKNEYLNRYERTKTQYETAKKKGSLRNQELFKNNMREKGILTKCYLCGCEIENILDAAHLWGVADIEHSTAAEINSAYSDEKLNSSQALDNGYRRDQFYKKYMLANSGNNGIWLCKNHHGLFDKNFYCFNSSDGKVLITKDASSENKKFFDAITADKQLPKNILTDETKLFLSKRQEKFDLNQ